MDQNHLRAARKYAKSKQVSLREASPLGYGSDGTVWPTSRNTAIKAFTHPKVYGTEVACYQRLREHEITRLAGFAIPALYDFDDSLMVIEIEIVQPPFLLDFGKVHIDTPPPYWGDRQMMANVYEEWRERFDDEWQDVACVLAMLQKYGIYYVDPRPGNIRLHDEIDDMEIS